MSPVRVTVGSKQGPQPAGPTDQLGRDVHAIQMAVHLQSRPGVGRRTENRVQVDIDRWPDSDSPASQMGDDVDLRIGNGIQETPCLFAPVKGERGVDGGDGKVESVENGVGKVEFPVAIDVEL